MSTRTHSKKDRVNNVETAAGAKQPTSIATLAPYCVGGLLPQREVTNSKTLLMEILHIKSKICLIPI